MADMLDILKLQRNDVEGAVALARQLEAEGKYGPDVGEPLLLLQDDPRELIQRLTEELGGDDASS